MKHNEALEEVFKSLIRANLNGLINDTIFTYSFKLGTLWEYIMGELEMDETDYENFEKEVIDKMKQEGEV